jgi:hypothetical protein
MQTIRRTSLALMLGCLLTATMTAQADARARSVTCKDGTTSPAGRGACSHHGGLSTATVACTDGTTSKPGRGACSHHGGIAKGGEPATAPPAAGAPAVKP